MGEQIIKIKTSDIIRRLPQNVDEDYINELLKSFEISGYDIYNHDPIVVLKQGDKYQIIDGAYRMLVIDKLNIDEIQVRCFTKDC